MKKQSIASILSTVTVLFIWSSMSYAAAPTAADWVNAHNKYRRRHIDTPDVKWSNALTQSAQNWADKCQWKHSDSPNGENMAEGGFSNAEEVVELWYEEIEDYDYNNPVYTDDTGHFTQVVWKETTEIGCGYNSSCGIYVCHYNPPGNYFGQFPANVKPMRSMGDDILWHHGSGHTGVWYMDGSGFKSAARIKCPPPAPVEWKLVGAADFNNDGQTDILWRNGKTGHNVVWQMEGSQIKAHLTLKGENDLNWRIVGTGDFNGDGRSDILWRHKTSNQTLVWLMDGVKFSQSVYLPHSTHPHWEIVGAGDFNADYHCDVLWRNTEYGTFAVWYLHQAKYKGLDIIAAAHLDWEVGATGDINSDSKTDILWRNVKSGDNAVWYMDGATFTSSDWLPPIPDLNFKMVGAGNFE